MKSATLGPARAAINHSLSMPAIALYVARALKPAQPKAIWPYGQAQMRAEHLQSKPADIAAVCIGFRSARSGP